MFSGGANARLRHTDVTLRPLDYWESEAGVRYPARWEISAKVPVHRLPSLGLIAPMHSEPGQSEPGRSASQDEEYTTVRFVVEPRVPDQLWRGRFESWEGLTEVRTLDGTRLGAGYVELTGYRDGVAAP